MSTALLLIPDFSLILIGFILLRITKWGDSFWIGLEKMVYFVMFPALLFLSTSRTPINLAATGKMLQIAVAVCVIGIILGWLAKPVFKVGPKIFESGVQTAWRFNSYIGLALAYRLLGDEGTSLMALILGLAVPICNAAAVHALAHGQGGLAKELAKNPMLIATICGVAFNLLGFSMPDVVNVLLSRLGNASIALGLLLVGAGLRLSGLQQGKALSAYFLDVKLLVLPAAALLMGRALELPPQQMQIIMIFAALPTASSAYVLTTRMGGNGPMVAFIISASTVLCAFTLPLWLAIAG